MNKMSRIAVIFTAILMMLNGMVGVCLAEPIPSGFSIWDTKLTDDINKSWMVKFNGQPATETVNSSNIYVVDSDERPVDVICSISGDGTAVNVKPLRPYTVGNEYRLYVTDGVCRWDAGDRAGTPLSDPLVMPFIIARDGCIKSINNAYNTLLTVIEITTDPSVYSVCINGTTMQYQGKNKFKLGVAKLELGAKVTVTAYDSSGKSLATLKYTIK